MATLFSDSEIDKIRNTYFTTQNGMEPDAEFMQRIKNFEVQDSDTFVIGFPKSGTTWSQEMVWLIANDLNFEGAKSFIDERFPILEQSRFNAKEFDIDAPLCHANSIEFVENLKHPRFIKSHLQGSYLPEQIQNGSRQPKIIYVARNPEDCCLSGYYFVKNLLKCYTGSLDDFCKVFMAGLGGFGSYWEHVLYFWKKRNESNILFIKYEDMKSNLSEVIRQVAVFLEKPLTEQQVTTLIKWLDFDSMKNNPGVNHDDLYKKSGFMRKGKVGGFKEEMSADIIKTFNIWTKESTRGFDWEM